MNTEPEWRSVHTEKREEFKTKLKQSCGSIKYDREKHMALWMDAGNRNEEKFTTEIGFDLYKLQLQRLDSA